MAKSWRCGRLWILTLVGVALLDMCAARSAHAQQPGQPPAGNVAAGDQPNRLNAVFDAGGLLPPGNGNNPGGPGGSAQADFDTLIDLITSTVEAESWAENGTGEGEIQPFDINGVYVDASGALRFRQGKEQAPLAALRRRGANSKIAPAGRQASEKPKQNDADAARQASPLRFVSLSKLEAAIADCQQRHVPLEPAMLSLAGLQRISFVFAYPETGDLVLAGPAGDWAASPGGGLVSVDGGQPVVRLDDLLALWRRQRTEKSTAFGCSIVPRQEALAATQEFLAASAAKPLEPGDRRRWLAQLRDALGQQDVEYYNIDPDTRIASLLLAADYHMKLVGMGLADGVPGIKSYLATVRNGADGSPPPMAVLRWWFAMPASTVEATDSHDAFAMPARCVCVLSENELLAARGQRVHTGQSEDLNRRFAESFTAQFDALAMKYPLYGELERVFELALALAVIEREGLTEAVGWTPDLLLDENRLRLPKRPAPRTVETVINHRVVGGRQIIAGISGGVWVDGGKSLQVSTVGAESKQLALAKKPRGVSTAEGEGEIVWWWD